MADAPLEQLGSVPAADSLDSAKDRALEALAAVQRTVEELGKGDVAILKEQTRALNVILRNLAVTALAKPNKSAYDNTGAALFQGWF